MGKRSPGYDLCIFCIENAYFYAFFCIMKGVSVCFGARRGMALCNLCIEKATSIHFLHNVSWVRSQVERPNAWRTRNGRVSCKPCKRVKGQWAKNMAKHRAGAPCLATAPASSRAFRGSGPSLHGRSTCPAPDRPPNTPRDSGLATPSGRTPSPPCVPTCRRP